MALENYHYLRPKIGVALNAALQERTYYSPVSKEVITIWRNKVMLMTRPHHCYPGVLGSNTRTAEQDDQQTAWAAEHGNPQQIDGVLLCKPNLSHCLSDD